MLTTDTKKHIDAARQVLVGVVPNPATQIDQITNALIYKFMDDMDQMAIKAGGKPSFFIGDLERYAWTRIMDSRLGNQERMNLYSEALVKFSEAKQLPELFRNIFKSAFLPYRSPEVLGLFLKEISFFDYKHSEELGNAYEYLLSIMSSQGDAGQFRTPRHIIDFIVDVVNPTKNDKILDPACGTAGFLISAYKHILKQHDGKDDPEKKEKPLTPDDRKKLVENFEGYDIDPTMARIAQVNMYLHQFKNPKIFQYDSLSSDEKWNEKFDVVLANPPFMSPKGGIRPHSKFSIQSSRSEVLFVDYIMNHLRPKGRAGIIVPEGIVFQSGGAHKQLRKNLVEDGLYAVISLPGGVFSPYSGVKTSILFFDNDLAKHREEILFIKIENDGFDLGATKKPIKENDLPVALEILNNWKIGKKNENKIAIYVEKSKISGDGEYNLNGDRYRVSKKPINAKWPMVELGELVENVISGIWGQDPDESEIEVKALKVSDIKVGGVINFSTATPRSITLKQLKANELKKGDIVVVKSSGSTKNIISGKCALISEDKEKYVPVNFLMTLRLNDKIIPRLLYHYLSSDFARQHVESIVSGATYPNLKKDLYLKFKVPLPPLEIQSKIVKEIEEKQAIIEDAKGTIMETENQIKNKVREFWGE